MSRAVFLYLKFIVLTLAVFASSVMYALPEKIVFIKRNTYDSNHYYTEFINSKWQPGGGLFVLDTKTNKVTPLFKGLENGVVGRFDISFDAKKIVFSFKDSQNEGYRIYEGNIATGEVKQLTFPVENEKQLQKKFGKKFYHNGTDDLDPCYLPDGGIAFISTRPQLGVLCDGSDILTVTLLHRMDADGKNIRQLSFGALSENSPTVMQDGRILYTRWEYVDKGASAVKGLWAMRPDGTNSTEIYGNDIALPPTFIFARPIPDEPHQFVYCATPHYPQSSHGTIIKADTTKGTRSPDAMKYITPNTDIQLEGGYHFKDAKTGKWIFDKEGKGELFRDPYPISKTRYLVSVKPNGKTWKDPNGYALAVLEEDGTFKEFYRDPNISCFEPFPLQPRKTPPDIHQELMDEPLRKRGQATVAIIDVYKGMENVKRGDAKYIRVLEQVARPWNARRKHMYDQHGQQHAVVSKDSHLSVKVLLGIVPIEDDGSAQFVVPADKNIFLQVLDKNYMALQTERTFVNYMSGEWRACIGCHEHNREASAISVSTNMGTVKALRKAPQQIQAQPDGLPAKRTLDFERDIQPIFDKYCISCHNDESFCGKLDLRGERTTLFNVAYESLMPDRKNSTDRKLLGTVIGEIYSKITNVEYLPAGSLGARTAPLVAIFAPDKSPLKSDRISELAKLHSSIKLTSEELLRLTTWIDTNCQYYPSYWGARHIKFKNLPNFRPAQTYEDATRKTEK